MTDLETWEHLVEVFRRTFKAPGLELRPESSAWDVPGWDSLAHLQLVLAVEREFQVRFEAHEILAVENAGHLHAAILRKHPPR